MSTQVANGPSATSKGDATSPSPGSGLKALSSAHGLPSPDEGYFKARDGTAIRYAHWQASGRDRQGSVLQLNGRTEFIEKTIETYAILARSGLDVWTLDWRGQGLSGRALADPDKGHVTDYQDYLDDLDQFVNEITDLTASEGTTIMVAHSMGGHIGLRYLQDRPGLIDKAVFSAPMLDLSVNKAPVRWLNSVIRGLGFGEHYAIGTKPFRFTYNAPDDPSDNGRIEDYRDQIDRFKILTHDARRFMEIQQMIRQDRGLALGGPTADWLDATFHSINLTWSKGYAEAIDTPILIIGGGRDEVVVTNRQEEMAKRLPNGRFQVFEHAAHELLIECDDVRLAFLKAFADFTGCSLDLPAPDMSNCIRQG